MKEFKFGYVALIGKPNVGKSTLLNEILGQKISIVSEKPQTTRNKIMGIKNLPYAQIVFIDTPGLHKPRHKLGEFMLKQCYEAIDLVDIIALMVEPKMPEDSDISIINKMKNINKNVFLLINKIDIIQKQKLLPLIDAYKKLYDFCEVIPVSALMSDGVDRVIESVISYLPEGQKLYPDDMITEQAERFLASEFIREKIMKYTEDEVPYSVAVEIENWQESKNLLKILSNIYVERDGQKIIIIGKKGEKLKKIATEARIEMEKFFGIKVFLQIWVKVRKKWRQRDLLLKSLGY